MSRWHRIDRVIKWLYPGIRVKRWIALSGASAIVFVIGLFRLFELSRYLEMIYPSSTVYSYLSAALLMLLGIGGISFGINRVARTIVRGISPGKEGQASEILYHKQRLSKGPQVVTVGGGTGLSTLLRGLKRFTSNLTAVVTVMDDGGSSGRIREELDLLPPGDIRNCLIALAEDESKISELFQHRFKDGKDLVGHSLGNLFIAGMQQITGSFDVAIEETSKILATRGQVLPATLEQVNLVAEMEDGDHLTGESALTRDPRRIRQISLSKTPVLPYAKVVTEIRDADIIVLGPGSLFTSLIPNLLIENVSREIERARAVKLYVLNLMTQPGETDGFTARDHLRTLNDYITMSTFDVVIVNTDPIPAELLEHYRAENAIPVYDDLDGNELGLEVIRAGLLDVVELEGKPTVKHKPEVLAQAIRTAWSSRSKGMWI
ncbi:MAG: uridine diphosphate-N-acetylglucosamine-binding protein YvcK [Candidatus Bipolaricaulia bacterium]